MALILPTVPIRLVLAVILMSFMGIISSIAALGWCVLMLLHTRCARYARSPEDQPLPPSRRGLVYATSSLTRGLLWLCFVRLRVKGLQNYTKHRNQRMVRTTE